MTLGAVLVDAVLAAEPGAGSCGAVGAYAPRVRSATTTFRGHPSTMSAARRWVVCTLHACGLDATGWSAAHVVPELVMDCTLHTRSDSAVRVLLAVEPADRVLREDRMTSQAPPGATQSDSAPAGSRLRHAGEQVAA